MTSPRPLNSHYDADPGAYARRRDSWLQERRMRRVESFLAGTPAGGSVLELGSGTGDVLMRAAKARPDVTFVGLEPLANYVEFATGRVVEAGIDNVRFEAGFAETAADRLEPLTFDRFVTSDVLHHVADDGATCASLARLAAPEARWLAIEPNRLNPYICAFQALTGGERNFRPGPFLRRAASAGWACVDRTYLFLIPAAVKTPPAWLRALEERYERVPPLAGGVALQLRLRA